MSGADQPGRKTKQTSSISDATLQADLFSFEGRNSQNKNSFRISLGPYRRGDAESINPTCDAHCGDAIKRFRSLTR